MEKAESAEAVTRVSTRQWAKETNYNAEKIFNKLFCDDIKYLLSMTQLWEKRKPPTPIVWENCVEDATALDQVNRQNLNIPIEVKYLTVVSISKDFTTTTTTSFN